MVRTASIGRRPARRYWTMVPVCRRNLAAPRVWLPPGASGLNVDGGVLRTARDIETDVKAEPAGDLITEARTFRADRTAVAEAGARAPGAPEAEEADQRPARRHVPA